MAKLKVQAENPFLPIFEIASGSGYELGLQIGTKCKERIQKTLVQSNNWFIERKERDNHDPSFLDLTLEIAKKYLPKYVEEIRGYADGANVDFRDICILNSADYATEETCSEVILRTSDKIVIGHNEDFNNANSDLSYFLHIISENYEIFTHTYPGVVPGFSFGLNSSGLTMSCNSLPNTDRNVGVSRKLLDRWALESSNIAEFVERISFKPRSGVFSYNIASMTESKVLNIETTEQEIYVTEPMESHFHTNHYLCEKWKPKNRYKDPTTTSFHRYNRLKEIVQDSKVSTKSAFDIISDPGVFTREAELYPGWYGKSFASVVYDITPESLKMVIWPYSRERSAIFEVTLQKT